MKLKTWDGHSINDGTNYEAIINADFYGLPNVEATLAMRTSNWPLVGGIKRPGRLIHFEIYIRGSSLSTLQKQLTQWFDPEDETPAKLIAEDDAGGNDRYVYAICTALQEVPFSAGLHYSVELRVHGDVRWRENTASTSSWSITASGQTKAVTNNGQDDAYPIFRIKPTSNKTGGYLYKRFMIVNWRSTKPESLYPVDICNDSFSTSTLVSGGKMQADGDDLRVKVDGVEVTRWLDGINTTTTKVWVNLDFLNSVTMALSAGITDSDTVIPVTNEYSDLTNMPAEGIIQIDSELITYTGISSSPVQFTGCTRGAKGTTAASHSAAAAVYWIQHDIWILYGNSSATAPSQPMRYKPIFDLSTSTNTSWDYNDFRQESWPDRPRSWQKNALDGAPTFYGGNQGASATTYVELGINCYNGAAGRYSVYNRCGITGANFQNGQMKTSNNNEWTTNLPAYVEGMNTLPTEIEYTTIAAPSTNDTWESWSSNITFGVTFQNVFLYLSSAALITNYLEAADVTLTLDSTATPSITVGSEQANYQLACTLANTTTGESIALAFEMALNQELEVNTDLKTITYLLDNSAQFAALTIATPRRDWLRLQAGSNTLQFTDTGTAAVTISISWEERHYQ